MPKRKPKTAAEIESVIGSRGKRLKQVPAKRTASLQLDFETELIEHFGNEAKIANGQLTKTSALSSIASKPSLAKRFVRYTRKRGLVLKCANRSELDWSVINPKYRHFNVASMDQYSHLFRGYVYVEVGKLKIILAHTNDLILAAMRKYPTIEYTRSQSMVESVASDLVLQTFSESYIKDPSTVYQPFYTLVTSLNDAVNELNTALIGMLNKSAEIPQTVTFGTEGKESYIAAMVNHQRIGKALNGFYEEENLFEIFKSNPDLIMKSIDHPKNISRSGSVYLETGLRLFAKWSSAFELMENGNELVAVITEAITTARNSFQSSIKYKSELPTILSVIGKRRIEELVEVAKGLGVSVRRYCAIGINVVGVGQYLEDTDKPVGGLEIIHVLKSDLMRKQVAGVLGFFTCAEEQDVDDDVIEKLGSINSLLSQFDLSAPKINDEILSASLVAQAHDVDVAISNLSRLMSLWVEHGKPYDRYVILTSLARSFSPYFFFSFPPLRWTWFANPTLEVGGVNLFTYIDSFRTFSVPETLHEKILRDKIGRKMYIAFINEVREWVKGSKATALAVRDAEVVQDAVYLKPQWGRFLSARDLSIAKFCELTEFSVELVGVPDSVEVEA